MSRIHVVAMVLAALSVFALLIVTASYERKVRLLAYISATVLLAGAGGLIVFTQPWHTDHWGYMNPIAGFYLFALAIAPAWAAVNLIRRA